MLQDAEKAAAAEAEEEEEATRGRLLSAQLSALARLSANEIDSSPFCLLLPPRLFCPISADLSFYLRHDAAGDSSCFSRFHTLWLRSRCMRACVRRRRRRFLRCRAVADAECFGQLATSRRVRGAVVSGLGAQPGDGSARSREEKQEAARNSFGSPASCRAPGSQREATFRAAAAAAASERHCQQARSR